MFVSCGCVPLGLVVLAEIVVMDSLMMMVRSSHASRDGWQD